MTTPLKDSWRHPAPKAAAQAARIASLSVDLGGEFDLESMVVWNMHVTQAHAEENSRGVQNFDLILADSTLDLSDIAGSLPDATVDTFSNLTLQMAITDQFAAGEVVDFADTPGVQYAIIDVISNYDGSNYTGLSEVRFTGVPEPTSIALLGLGLVGLAVVARRKK